MKLKLQDIVFPKDGICDVEDLYYRKLGVPCSREIYTDKVVLKKDQRINFDTYYNSFSMLKWKTYTYADTNYSLHIKLKGKFVLKLIHMYLKPNGEIEYITLDEKEINATQITEYEFPYITDNPFGCLAFGLECLKDDSVMYEASYVSDVDVKPNKVNLGIGICTFKRESYVLNNIANIKKYIFDNKQSGLYKKLNVFISDNAQTLDKDQFEIPNVHLVYNKNTGGSGGFTRCMIEAIKYNNATQDKLTHLILMDDDIKFDPTSLERTYTMLSLLKDEYQDAFVGGAMLKMDYPNIQHCSGEYWHGDKCENFIESFNTRKDLIDVKQILENESFVNSNHQGWWFCAIPIKFIREDNLSLPFFIKSDDIEFSIRNMKHHILLNGINVWHESFESKYSAQNEYYTVRNYLISAAAQKQPITKDEILQMLYNYTKHYICNYKYIEIEHFCNAINDFLGGVDKFKKIDLAEYHKGILSKGYKMVDVNQLPINVSDAKYYKDISYFPSISKSARKFRKMTVNGLLLPAKGYSILGMWGGTNEQTYRKKFLVRYEINTKKGFILTRSLSKALKCYFMYKKTKRNIKRKFDKAYKDFEKRWNELCNLDNWNNYL